MIYGIGTDIVEVQRVEEKIRKGKGFRELVFTPLEVAYCEQQAAPYEHYAARFAAKEAFLKALGTGWGHGGVNFNEIEVRNNTAGKPELHLLGNAASRYTELSIKQVLLSLSHVKTTAIAMVVIEV
ncbi:holo-[acyl-carrier-protein] synthase [Chitinophaga agrisoli]|uniref:Holo-[acyl-carrier-protein] synthase n=1 Tax=Chitinophaga agrisoli TaxID=2607653 RepID=A0A5B2VT36_9BACT|nr:holo-ACP synthase [Chitinophaga agrisoli]KAA2241820.1 holo-[acyl-carrier-protein] synthase [Chitinophaga agrisoli]